MPDVIVWQTELHAFLKGINDGTGPDLKPMLINRLAGKPCILLNNKRLRVKSDRRFGQPRFGFLRAQLLVMKSELAKYAEHPDWLTLDQSGRPAGRACGSRTSDIRRRRDLAAADSLLPTDDRTETRISAGPSGRSGRCD